MGENQFSVRYRGYEITKNMRATREPRLSSRGVIWSAEGARTSLSSRFDAAKTSSGSIDTGIDSGVSDCFLENEKSKKIFYHRGSNYGTSTLNRTHLTDYGCPDDDIEFFEIENKTLTELLAKHHIDHLDYLFIDAEGFDIDILMSLDLSLVTVENIHLEIVHSDGAFKRGQKFKMLCEYLKSKDYDFTVNDVDLTAKRTRDNLK